MSDVFRAGISEHIRVAQAAIEQVDLIGAIADRLIATFESGNKLLVFGNGGSAADAQHIAAELVGRFRSDHRPLPAIALTTDTSILTAVGNDFGFDEIFARQVNAMASPGDAVWALSVSGRSPNVLHGLDAARDRGAATIGFTGRSGGSMKDRCELLFQADHECSDRVQEIHQLAYHLICQRVEAYFPALPQGA
ncbi:MAG: D-sedoheptulose 7-phosphate isomerase [Phycisphaerae bacterium]|nr:D-sedoheptulose 7-phosphate isomerase [Phycisphaerae bacterium]